MHQTIVVLVPSGIPVSLRLCDCRGPWLPSC